MEPSLKTFCFFCSKVDRSGKSWEIYEKNQQVFPICFDPLIVF